MSGQTLTSIHDLPPTDTRVKHVFVIPPSLRGVAKGYTHLGFFELNANEEMMAHRRARGDAVAMAFELARESLRFIGKAKSAAAGQEPEIEWKAITTADGSSDAVWSSLHPKIRNLCVSAYGELHNPKENELASFLGSREIIAG